MTETRERKTVAQQLDTGEAKAARLRAILKKETRNMVSYISPRPGVTGHPLTLHAAGHMTDLIARAARFRSKVT